MKRIFAATTAALLLAGMTVTPAFAESTTYDFSEYGVSCSVPSGFYAFTQDMEEDDPALDMLGISYEDEMDYLTADGSNIILDMTDDSVTFELSLAVYDAGDTNDLSTYSEEELEALINSYVDYVYSDSSYDMGEYSVSTFQGQPYFWIPYSINMNGVSYYFIDCDTVSNGFEYVYTMFSYVDEITDSQVSCLEELLNSAVYTVPTGEVTETNPAEAGAEEEFPAIGETEEPTESEESPAAETEETPAEGIISAEDDTADKTMLLYNLLGGLVAGLVMGLIPLIVGLVKRQKALAWIGFAVCIVCGILLGILLALPAAIVFLVIILVKAKKDRNKWNQGGGYPPNMYHTNGTPQNFGSNGYDQSGGFSGQDPWNQSGAGNSSGNFNDPW